MNIFTRSLISLMLFPACFTAVFAQDAKEQAHLICLNGIDLLNRGEVQDALKLFTQAQSLDPENFFYPYEIAHAHYQIRHYKQSIAILEKLLQHKDATDRAYVLLGNSYDNSGHANKAMEIYHKGLQLFPNSGELYLSLATVEMHKKKYEKALEHFEKGIEVDPEQPANYYWASKLHASMDGKIWGIIYGEIYMNLEPGSERSKEIRNILADVYKKCIVNTPEGFKTGFSRAEAEESSALSFEAAFEQTMGKSVEGLKAGEVTLDLLHQIRNNFLMNWISSGYSHQFPNILFDWHSKLAYKGYLESYNYWLLGNDDDELQKWQQKNKKKYDTFIKWLPDNRLLADPTHLFFSRQYFLN